jgi:hypothetical protein
MAAAAQVAFSLAFLPPFALLEGHETFREWSCWYTPERLGLACAHVRHPAS